MEVRSDRLPALDGLRGLAALSVLIGHHNANPAWVGFSALSAVQSRVSASLAVCVFFTLSAFLLTYLLVTERACHGRVSIGRFFVRRIFRIWPLYFVVLGFGVWSTIHYFNFAHDDRIAWIVNHLWLYASFTSNWSQAFHQLFGWMDYGHSPQAVLWSIAVEEQFYLFCPFVVVALLRASPRQRLWWIAALLTAAMSYRLATLLTLWPLQTSMPRAIIYYATPSYIDVFVIGGAAGWLTARGSAIRVHGLVALGALALAAVVWRNMLVDAMPWAYLVAQPVVALGFSLTMLWLVQNPNSRPARVLGSWAFASMGALSYGMYLWHPIALDFYGGPLRDLTFNLPLDVRETISFAAFICVPIAVATVSYFLIERPARRLRQYLLSGRPASPGTQHEAAERRLTAQAREIMGRLPGQ